jgi:hypothetical protein
MRTVVDLPAPFGPSRPNTSPSRHGERDAGERLHALVPLLEPVDDDRVHVPSVPARLGWLGALDHARTFSIVACGPRRGEVGCAVQSRYFAVGAV